MNVAEIKTIIQETLASKANKLNLTDKDIVEIPPEIGLLTELRRLWIIGNRKLKKLPPEIGNLRNLKVLDLNRNSLSALPTEFSQLKNLTGLYLSGNKFTTIPKSIFELTELQELRLADNQITELPIDIKKLVNLRELDLRGNPLSIPPEIIKNLYDPGSIISAYLGRKRPLREAKVIVVGQGAVGKTSLIKRMLYDDFDKQETKTEGIQISQWFLDDVQGEDKNGQGESKIRLNIWDFGGQEIMHATHQFFLTKRSLYLLVLDSRLTQDENRVEYWLKIIQSFGGDSPILVVGNKDDQHPLDIDRSGLKKKYPNIIGFIKTSALNGDGILKLRRTIAEEVNKMPHVRDLLPATWFIIKGQLEGMGIQNNFITIDSYNEICVKNDVVDGASQRILIGFLHDLGIILHFQDDPRLEALGILNPQWVTNGVYKILNYNPLFHSGGRLTRLMLDEILDSPEYPSNKRLFIVDMMRKFELCYDIEPDKTFLVPDLLPKDEPFTGDWIKALAFQYHYNVLPTSIISRFIVRMNAYIHKTVWRSGVVLQKGGNTALVKADSEDRRIFIWVNGDETTRRDFLAAIRAEFDAIHKSIAKIEAREKVPVPEQKNVVVDFEHLLKLERKGINEFIPEGMDDPISVRQLLNGVERESKRRSENIIIVNGNIGGHFNYGDSNNLSTLNNGLVPETLPTSEPDSLDKLPPVGVVRGNIYFIFVVIPETIGRIPLDLVGKGKDAAKSTSVVLGYILIIFTTLVLWGILDLDSLKTWFAGWWRFFFPVK